jgi:hypothetical protein
MIEELKEQNRMLVAAAAAGGSVVKGKGAGAKGGRALVGPG